MSLTKITRIKNGSIPLPKELQKKWRGAEVLIMPAADSVLIKKVSRPSLAELRPKLQKLGKLVSAKDIRDAVKWARNKTYKAHS